MLNSAVSVMLNFISILTRTFHALADALDVDYAKACELLKENYDGYHFCYKSVGMYNPFSLLNTFAKKQIGSYWFETVPRLTW